MKTVTVEVMPDWLKEILDKKAIALAKLTDEEKKLLGL